MFVALLIGLLMLALVHHRCGVLCQLTKAINAAGIFLLVLLGLFAIGILVHYSNS